MTDLYGILGVSRRATDAEIKSAYRKLARMYHPDVCKSPSANATFAQINEAYRILSDPKRRAMYDYGIPTSKRTTYYASRDAEVIAYQRKLDRVVDEMIAKERQETAARRQAVMVVVTLFLSSFMVALSKPVIIEDLNMFGRILLVLVSLGSAWYLIKSIRTVLARYTYQEPNSLISVFKWTSHEDKIVSRPAALVFLVSGYVVSFGLGYLLSALTLGHDKNAGTILGVLLYPPIAVMIIGSFQQIGKILDL